MGRSALGSDSDIHPTCRVPRTRRTRGYWLCRYSKTERPAPITTALTIPVRDLSPGSNSSHSLHTAPCQGSLLHKSLLDQRLLPLNLSPLEMPAQPPPPSRFVFVPQPPASRQQLKLPLTSLTYCTPRENSPCAPFVLGPGVFSCSLTERKHSFHLCQRKAEVIKYHEPHKTNRSLLFTPEAFQGSEAQPRAAGGTALTSSLFCPFLPGGSGLHASPTLTGRLGLTSSSFAVAKRKPIPLQAKGSLWVPLPPGCYRRSITESQHRLAGRDL